MRLDMFSVVDVSGPFLLYLALGALLAVWPLRLRGRLSGFAPAIYLAVATEIAQIVVAERLLDVTDLMIQASGATAGWVVVRRAGFRPYGAQLAPARERPRPDLGAVDDRQGASRTPSRTSPGAARTR
jgi:glycopeptide antibiotics resistance protein